MKKGCANPQDKLLEFERQKACVEAQFEVLRRSKGGKHVEAGAASPFQSVGPGVVPAAPTFTGQPLHFLASGLLEYA